MIKPQGIEIRTEYLAWTGRKISWQVRSNRIESCLRSADKLTTQTKEIHYPAVTNRTHRTRM